jgi:proton glutamate symport protein
VPIGLLGLLLAVETIPDICRTLGNVTMDLAVSRIVGRNKVESDARSSES